MSYPRWVRVSHLLWPAKGARHGGFHAVELFDMVKIINGAPHALEPVADALLLWNKNSDSFGPDNAVDWDFRFNVLRPIHEVALEEREPLVAARRKRKRRRADSLGAREQTSGTARPARAPVTDENDGSCDP